MASFFIDYSWLILVLPFMSFVLAMVFRCPSTWKISALIAISCNALAMVMAIGLAFAYAQGMHEVQVFETAWTFTWMSLSENMPIRIGFYLDHISIMMLMVITIISTLVHIYSVGYMRDDASAGRFFPLLSFFVFSMIGLVAAVNIVQMFIFWELVGVSSYMLIGFWYHKPSAVAASKKAFIITRFADAFFLIGILMIANILGTLDFKEMFTSANLEIIAASPLLTPACILVFIGGWGKSAMFPLHIWLPDAMEGPTPVSSIIHSATMVVAGIFLTARMFPVFVLSEHTMLVVEITGAATALFAAVIACTQKDIKRILAFSTLSQLGYMMFSLGVASADDQLGFSASMFHVFTHAFFKCLLFLSAGLVIHVVHTNDISLMGGLRKKLKLTYWATLIACIAIAGVFPFSGFFSKDEILLAAWTGHHYMTFSIGLGVGGLTAFYMFRYFILIFHGSYRGDEKHLAHAHEDPFMITPILILAVPSAAIGGLSLSTFLHNVVPPIPIAAGEHTEHAVWWLPYVATTVGLLGIAVAYALYARKTPDLNAEPKGIRKVIVNKFYIDEVYLFITHRIIFRCIAAPMKWVDDHIVDAAMNVCASISQALAGFVRRFQSGQVQVYLGMLIIGFILLVLFGGIVQ